MFGEANAVVSGGVKAAGRVMNTNEIERVLTLDRVGNQMDDNNSRLQSVVVRLRDYLDSLAGSIPTPGADKASGGVPVNGRLHGLQQLANQNGDLITALNNQLDRLYEI